MEKVSHLTCICCPMGCALTVTQHDNGEIFVEGNSCPMGDKYGRQEVVNPVRMVTSTVFVDRGELQMVSVKTSNSVPKDKVKDVVKALASLHVAAPVHIHDVLVKNILDLGVDIIATGEVGLR